MKIFKKSKRVKLTLIILVVYLLLLPLSTAYLNFRAGKKGGDLFSFPWNIKAQDIPPLLTLGPALTASHAIKHLITDISELGFIRGCQNAKQKQLSMETLNQIGGTCRIYEIEENGDITKPPKICGSSELKKLVVDKQGALREDYSLFYTPSFFNSWWCWVGEKEGKVTTKLEFLDND